MPSASTQAALGLLIALLATVALASSRSTAALPTSRLIEREQSASPKQAVRALRDGQTLDLNLADASELGLLPGVGPKLAQRILEERQRRGRFARAEDLLSVHGIGPVKLGQIVRFVHVAPQGADAQRSTSHETVSVPVK